jgi:hypothetical protein
MPANNSIRPDDDQALSPSGKPAAGENPEAAIFVPQPWPDLMPLENNQLLPKAEVLGDYSCSGLENGFASVGKAPNHRKVP